MYDILKFLMPVVLMVTIILVEWWMHRKEMALLHKHSELMEDYAQLQYELGFSDGVDSVRRDPEGMVKSPACNTNGPTS